MRDLIAADELPLAGDDMAISQTIGGKLAKRLVKQPAMLSSNDSQFIGCSFPLSNRGTIAKHTRRLVTATA